MALSLYDISVTPYLQVLGSVSTILDKSAAHFQANSIDPADIVETRLHPDMHPFRFQLVSVAHHTLGAARGIQAGVFTPPPSMPDVDYEDLQNLIRDASSGLQTISPEEFDALEGKTVIFKLGPNDMPFTAENFVTSFSLPNVFFHATTAYDILRMRGVPLGKLDYLGQMRLSA